MIRRFGFFRAALVSAAFFSAPAPQSALAQDAVSFGDKLTIVVGTPAGGGYDIYGRLVGRHIGRFLPGNPSAIVSNMPGAGSLVAANWLYNVAPKDGSTIALPQSAAMFEALLGNKNAQIDATKVNWLGSVNDYTAVAMVWANTPFRTAQDTVTREILIGAGGASSDVTLWPNVLNALAGTKFKLVKGYTGTADISLAMERGEVQGVVGDDFDSVRAGRTNWITENKVRFLLQLRTERHPDLPDVATGLELTKDDEARAVLRLLIERQKYGRNFIAPPGVRPPVVAALRNAFAQMVKDPEFLADALRLRVTLNFATGEEVSALVRQIHAAPKNIIERAAQVVRDSGG